jgi:hypothetical protein
MMQQLPVSRAENTYELLEEVIAIVTEETRCLVMDWYVTLAVNEQQDETMEPFPVDYGSRQEFEEAYGFEAPSCGTVCCVGGWMGVLRRRHNPDGFTAYALALKQVPRGLREAIESEVFMNFEGLKDSQRGTRPYVDVVVGRLRGFMERHEAALRAYALPEGGGASQD